MKQTETIARYKNQTLKSTDTINRNKNWTLKRNDTIDRYKNWKLKSTDCVGRPIQLEDWIGIWRSDNRTFCPPLKRGDKLLLKVYQYGNQIRSKYYGQCKYASNWQFRAQKKTLIKQKVSKKSKNEFNWK